ncbi:MAG: triose-phosphate isomerase [Desulfobacteraceae bacterium]
MNERTPMMAGNWKMNLSLAEAISLAGAVAGEAKDMDGLEVLVAPPFTSLHAVREAVTGGKVLLAGQNMHWEPKGAFTGEISARMLREARCTHVILGHSERRLLFGEDDEMVNLKARTADLMGLIPILCIGETLEQREAGKTFEVLRSQLQGSLRHFREEGRLPFSTILAYEPVWAIGTGRTATPEQAQEAHLFIRKWLEENFNTGTSNLVRILYGGSVKPENVKELMAQPDIDGTLVGGASLKAETFIPIIRYRD